MKIKTLIFTVLSCAVSNPGLQQQARKIAKNAVSKAKPPLMKGSRVAGEMCGNISKEIKNSVIDLKKKNSQK